MRAGISSGSNVIAAAKGPGRDRGYVPAQDRRDAFDVNVINTRGNLIGGPRSSCSNAAIAVASLAEKKEKNVTSWERRNLVLGVSPYCPWIKR